MILSLLSVHTLCLQSDLMKQIIMLCVFVTFIACVVCAEDEAAFIYKSRGKRDPFVPLVGALAEKKEQPQKREFDINTIKFQGTAVDAKGNMAAIINDELFKEGDIIGAQVKITKIMRNGVIVVIDGKERKLELFEEY
jgi:hypothetical protein